MSSDQNRWQIEITGTDAAPDDPARATRGGVEETIPDSRVDRSAIVGGPARKVRLGPYAIQRELGRGGQGVVYLAEDTRLGRPVALKVLSNSFGADSWARLRFEREATATARLDHPGICTVYEAGTIDDTPFIAMRLVSGEPLLLRTRATKAAQPARPTTTGGRQRREALFADAGIIENVARAVHAAHEAGLVHRDLKPGNVMVEASGQPVVLDFGLARDALNADLLLTGTGAFLGTPPYMSPEQVDGTRAVDRRTDVWSLGVMLYEIATGTRPFDAPTIEGLMRAIRTVDPADPRRLNPAVTPELAAVILTALEKDAGRRYQDALALADDLGRARRLEPVHARAPSAPMRVKRWAQRNPAVAASLAVVFLALSTALAISIASLDAAEQALGRERTALDEARDQRNRAEDLLSFMLVEMKEQLDSVGRLDLLGKVARKADDYFATRPLDLAQAKESLQRALALRNVGDVLRAEGDVTAAVARYEEAVRIEEELWRRDPDDPAPLKDLVSSVHALAVTAMQRGDPNQTLAKAERSLGLRRKLVALMPDDGDARALLVSGMVMQANALKFADRPKDALPIYEEAIAQSEALCGADSRPMRRRELAIALQNYGEAQRAAGDSEGAIAARLKGLAIFEALAAEEPKNLDWSEQVAATHHGLGIAFGAQREAAKATEHAKQAVAIFRRLLAEDPVNKRRLFQLGTALFTLANDYSSSGHKTEALQALEESTTARARLVALDPANRSWKADLVDNERQFGVILASMGRTDEALRHYEASVSLARALANERPDDSAGQRTLGRALDRAAQILWELGRPAESLDRYLAAVEAGRAACSGPEPTVRAAGDLALHLENASDMARTAGDRARSRELLGAAIEQRRVVLRRCADGERSGALVTIGKDLASLGEWNLQDGTAETVFGILDESVAHLADPRLKLRDKERADVLVVHARLALADARAASNNLDEAEAEANRAESAYAALSESARSAGTTIKVQARLDSIRRLRGVLSDSPPGDAVAHEALARHLFATGRPVEAVAAFVPALTSDEMPESVRLRALETAIYVATRALEAAPAEARARIEAIALGWIAQRAASLIGRQTKLESRLRAQTQRGAVENAVREELAEVRCELAALRVHDPALAPLRKLPGFQAAVTSAP